MARYPRILLLLICFSGLIQAQQADTATIKLPAVIQELLKEAVNQREGTALPPFDLRLLEGGRLYSEQLAGKPSLLVFWFTSCAPCIEEIPALNALRSHFADAVNFVAITFEEAPEVSAFLQEHPFHFRHLIDSKSYIKYLGVTFYPKALVLDQDLVIRHFVGLPKNGATYQQDLQTKLEGVLEL